MVERRESKATGKTLACMDSRQVVKQTQIQNEAELQVERVQAIGYVGQQGMQVVAMASQMEANLASLVPLRPAGCMRWATY
jgi:hypothetical protein